MTENLDCAILGLMLKVLGYILNGIPMVLGFGLGLSVFKLADFLEELRPVLQSIVFQVALSLLALYATSSGQSLLASSFLLSALAKSFYLQYQDHRKGRLGGWFWVLKEPVTKGTLVIYFAVVGVLFLYSVMNLVL